MLRNNQGMTLIEIVVVIVLISLIFGVVAKGVFGQGDKQKMRLEGLNMEKLKGQIDLYRLEHNTFPSDIKCLMNKCAEVQGVFVPLVDEKDLKSVWGHEYVYRVESDRRSYSLTSYGKDGTAGGSGVDEDIVLKP